MLLGAKDGRCLLLNLKSKSIIHIFDPFPSRITVLQASPVVDVVAVGTSGGAVYLYNLKAGQVLFSFQHSPQNVAQDNTTNKLSDNPQTVSSISFRTDGTECMVTTDLKGDMFVWDLKEKNLRHQLGQIHPNGVNLGLFLAGEPILITSGLSDNAIKVHLFDDKRDEIRLLRSREGHYLPPTVVRFCSADGLNMVSAGLDRELRLVSVVHEAKNRVLSQASTTRVGRKARKRRRTNMKAEVGDQSRNQNLSLPPILSMAVSEARERDSSFANIVTVHAKTQEVFTWRMQNSALHKFVLVPPPGPRLLKLSFSRDQKKERSKSLSNGGIGDQSISSYSTCVEQSPCGNFAFVGSSCGRIHVYNLQSGFHQGVYGDKHLSKNKGISAENEWGLAHSGSILRVAVDAVGDVLASAGAQDGAVKFWNVHTRQLMGTSITAPSDILSMVWCKSSDLLALGCDDFSIYVYDSLTRKLARRFVGHRGPLVDLSFDTRGLRVLTASLDGTIRAWDLPSGRSLLKLDCEDVPTSIAMAPCGSYMASTHANDLSVKVWIDTSKFNPLTLSGSQSAMIDSSNRFNEVEGEGGPKGNSLIPTRPFRENVVTLSAKPITQWTVLRNLQAIKDRNKPLDAPVKPKSAPFFIPSLPKPRSGDSASPQDLDETKLSKGVHKSSHSFEDDEEMSEFGILVNEGKSHEAMKLLLESDASGVDFQIRSISSKRCRLNTARLFIDGLQQSTNFELTQAHLSVFLQSQGIALASQPDAIGSLKELLRFEQLAWQSFRETVDSVTSLSAFFAGVI